jgi:hypothetical protein
MLPIPRHRLDHAREEAAEIARDCKTPLTSPTGRNLARRETRDGREITEMNCCLKGKHEFVSLERLPDGTRGAWDGTIRSICPQCGLIEVAGVRSKKVRYEQSLWRGIDDSGEMKWYAVSEDDKVNAIAAMLREGMSQDRIADHVRFTESQWNEAIRLNSRRASV